MTDDLSMFEHVAAQAEDEEVEHDFNGDGVCPCQPTLLHLTEDGRAVWWHVNPHYPVPPVETVALMIAMARWTDLADVLEEA